MKSSDAIGPGAVQLQPAHRFATLDALRGVAALTVVQVHLPFLFAAHMPFPHAYLAVDFFFMLSGFVLTYAYGSRLSQGWPTLSFLRERIIRLYPLYLLALPLGFAYLLYTSHRNHTPLSPVQACLVLFLGLFLLPLVGSAGGETPYPFPANLPSWSLFYELVANVAHAFFLRSRSQRQLGFTLIFLGLLLIPIAHAYDGLNVGALKGELMVGLARVAFSYTAGIFLFDRWRGGHLRRFRSGTLATVLLAAVLLGPVPARGNAFADLVILFAVFPVILVLAANARVAPSIRPLASLLGTTSYAIYVLHVPLYAIFTTVWTALLHTKTADAAPLSGMAYVLLLLVVCYLLDRFYDLPLRRLLRRRFLRGKHVTL